jgi:hypothetical protein
MLTRAASHELCGSAGSSGEIDPGIRPPRRLWETQGGGKEARVTGWRQNKLGAAVRHGNGIACFHAAGRVRCEPAERGEGCRKPGENGSSFGAPVHEVDRVLSVKSKLGIGQVQEEEDSRGGKIGATRYRYTQPGVAGRGVFRGELEGEALDLETDTELVGSSTRVTEDNEGRVACLRFSPSFHAYGMAGLNGVREKGCDESSHPMWLNHERSP